MALDPKEILKAALCTQLADGMPRCTHIVDVTVNQYLEFCKNKRSRNPGLPVGELELQCKMAALENKDVIKATREVRWAKTLQGVWDSIGNKKLEDKITGICQWIGQIKTASLRGEDTIGKFTFIRDTVETTIEENTEENV